jgi:antitoxin (DNA-binding transcriptional repressor) of toxin-antitoxin stability system
MARTVAAADFEHHSLALLQEVAETNEEMLIVRDGKPLAKVIPVPSGERHPAALTVEEFRLRYPVRILADITEPLDDDWDVLK